MQSEKPFSKGRPRQMSPPDSTASVWSATFVPSKSPFPEYGREGYSVAWVDTATGRIQVLVDGPRPAPGVRGTIVARSLGDDTVQMFVSDPA